MQYYLVPCATSRPANHAIYSNIDSNGYAFGPIRRCLFIDYVINLLSNLFKIRIVNNTEVIFKYIDVEGGA